MPRGFAELYSEQTKMDFFLDIEEMLNAGGFFLERPDTGSIQVWNAEGDMIEIDRREISLHIQRNSLIVFWNSNYDDVRVILNEGSSVLFLDGFDAKESESLFNLIKSFVLSKHNNKLTGFVFDRREISENVDWSKCLQEGKLTMDVISNELRPVSQKNITMNSLIDFDVNNAYLVIRKTNDIFELFELKQNN